MENKKSSAPFALVLSLSIVFYIWLAAQIPYGWDDWTWGLPMGMERFLTASINCRYAGNLVEIIITRSRLLKDVIMGLCFALLPLSFLRGYARSLCLRQSLLCSRPITRRHMHVLLLIPHSSLKMCYCLSWLLYCLNSYGYILHHRMPGRKLILHSYRQILRYRFL